jgi:hypothetical protein
MGERERERIIEDNRLCAFCLLHDRAMVCGAKERKDRPVCSVPECKGRHIMRLHKFLKDMYWERSRVHLVQGDDGWEEPKGAWVVGEVEEEDETMLVNTVQQEESSWRESDNSWLELNGGDAGGVYCIRACHGEGGHVPGAEAEQPHEPLYLSEEEGAVEACWWSPDPTEPQFSKGEMEYLIDLLMGSSGAGRDEVEPARVPKAPSVPSRQTGKRGVTGREDHPQREVREGKLPIGKEPKKGAPKRQEACDEEAFRREPPEGNTGARRGNEASAVSGAGEAGARDGRGPWERCPWWPDGHGKEGSPDPSQSSRAEAEDSANLKQGKATKV